MSLVVLDEVTLLFADRMIFDAASLRLGHGDRIGLIGPNGSGKTTLLKVIAGEQEIDDGKVTRANGVRIAWLPQDLSVAGGRTLIDMILSSVPGRTELDRRLADAEAALEAASGDGNGGSDETTLLELAADVGDLHERIDHFDRFFGEHEALAILAGLGFAPGDERRDIGELSGGWRMRGVLAGLLFQRPDVLLLDEPTNHLDMPSVAWFSEFLKRWTSCFVLISHDREFLNEQINRVVSLELEGVRSYPGNYEKYLEQRAEEETILAGKARNLARERERLTTFINRFRAQANKAKAVQSRIKFLEKMESVETYEKRQVMRFSFPETERTAGEVIRIEGLRKAYGDHVVFPGIDLTVRRGEKIGIIGVNGAGKTTPVADDRGRASPRWRHHQDRHRREARLLRAAPYRDPRSGLDDLRGGPARIPGDPAQSRAVDPRSVHVLWRRYRQADQGALGRREGAGRARAPAGQAGKSIVDGRAH